MSGSNVRVGVLGGTFDPVHLGHLLMAEEARLQLRLDRVLFLPAGQPWLKEGQPLSDRDHRVEMVRLAIASNPYFEICLEEVQRPGPTYSVETIEALQRRGEPEGRLFFILGADAMALFHRWKEPERLLEVCEWVVVQRPGCADFDLAAFAARYPLAPGRVKVLTMPPIGVSGTEIRRRAAQGLSMRYQVPDPVAAYIEGQGLYSSSQTSVPPTSKAGGPPQDIARRLLDVALERGALKYGEFTLSSGKQSSYYFDGRLLSLDPEGAELIAGALLPILRDAGVEAVGGPTLGADPIVAAVAVTSRRAGNEIPAFIVRKEVKSHGTGQAIEGPLPPGSSVAIVDDVCTTGGALFHAITAAEGLGCTVVKVAAVLDRREGGSEELLRRGYDFVSLMAANPDGTVGVTSPGGPDV